MDVFLEIVSNPDGVAYYSMVRAPERRGLGIRGQLLGVMEERKVTVALGCSAEFPGDKAFGALAESP